ncbi:MAG: sigma-54-dependent Fis family transcriptional regulator [Bradymonadales bacterium]|nr:MAG: sigma-54-dependent Fis family transcriptional regulator [Bradymonadales bacterium]
MSTLELVNPDVGLGKESPKIRVLVVDDEANAREGLHDLLETWGYEVLTAQDVRTGFDAVKKFQPAVIITDLKMPENDGMTLIHLLRDEQLMEHTHVIVLSAHGNIEKAVEAIKLGVEEFLTKPVDVSRLKILLERIENRNRVYEEMLLLRDKVRKLGTFGKLNGSTPKMKAVFKQIQVVAPASSPVLITGESGTGKELVAKAIHQNSKRKDKAFLPVNCAAIPASLLESELFGHEKGAFTGAVGQKLGCFELANHGSLFLDEIGEMSPDLQSKLLRVLEDGSFRRLGGKTEIKVDVRVIAATNRNLEEAVEEDGFREDLFYRLNVFQIELPPLRERSEDIPLLIQTFIEEFNLKNDRQVKGLSREALKTLKRYSFPGNVRELKNVIERAVIVSQNDVIEPEDLPENLTKKAQRAPSVEFNLGMSMEEIEKEWLFHTINFVNGNKTKAAKMLNISLKTLHNRLNKYKSSV